MRLRNPANSGTMADDRSTQCRKQSWDMACFQGVAYQSAMSLRAPARLVSLLEAPRSLAFLRLEHTFQETIQLIT